MKAPVGSRRQASYDLAQDARPVVTALGLTDLSGAYGGASSSTQRYSSRQVSLEDILDLPTADDNCGDYVNTCRHTDLDFESSRVIVVNTKAGHRRKRSLSVSPRLGSRASGSSGSVADNTSTGGSTKGGFYTWMQSSLRRRLRKRAKKSSASQKCGPTTPVGISEHSGTSPSPPHPCHPQQPDTGVHADIGLNHHLYPKNHNDLHRDLHPARLQHHLTAAPQEPEVTSYVASPSSHCEEQRGGVVDIVYSQSYSPTNSTPSHSPNRLSSHVSSSSCTFSPISAYTPTTTNTFIVSSSSSNTAADYQNCCVNLTPVGSSSVTTTTSGTSQSCSTPSHPGASPPLSTPNSSGCYTDVSSSTLEEGGCNSTQEEVSDIREPVTYVNHRNGSVTAVSAASVLLALTSGSSGATSSSSSSVRPGAGSSGRVVVSSGRIIHSTRGRSSSAGRRVALGVNPVPGSSSTKKGSKKNKGKRHRVLGGAWGLFHCAGAGARSRSCTPERHANFRVNRSRSATPERYMNVRINQPQPPIIINTTPKGKKTGGGLNIMKGKSSKKRAKSSRRRVSDDSEDDANKENKYDMWGFIKDRLDWSGSGRTPKTYATERLSRRDTLPCRPRGSVNINRELAPEFVPPAPPELPALTRSISERRYDENYRAPCCPLPPKDMCTYIQRVPPTTDVNFNNYGAVMSIHLKRGETLPLNLQKCTSGQTSVGSSMTSVASKDSYHSKDSGVSTISGRTERSHSTHGRASTDGTSSSRDRTNTLPTQRYRNRPLPPIPKPEVPPKPQESGIHLVRTLKLDKFMKNKWISGVAVTKKGDLVVVDLKGAYLVDPEGGLKRTIGTSGKGMLKEPIDVTILPNGNVAFSDHADQEVKVFTTKGQFVRRIMDKCLANIAGVAAAISDKSIYIAGTDKRCITVHSEEEGYLYSIPSKDGNATLGASGMYKGPCTSGSGSLKELFEHPYSIAINPLTGDIIVGDDYKQRVVALSAVDGRVLWRYSPTGDRHFFPCSIAVDAEGYIFIADLYNEKIYMLDSSGKHLKVLLSRGEGLKGGPGAIAVDGRGHLVVADEERTLRVFKYGEKGFALYRRFSMCPDAK